MTKDEALKLALHGLEIGSPLIEDFGSTKQLNALNKAIAAIYEAFAQRKGTSMTKDEIIELARKAGVRDDEHIFEFSQYKYLEHFAKLVAEKEREACAKIADEYAKGLERNYSEIIADEIRARSKHD